MPPLPHLIEFIESVTRPDGSFAAEHGGYQAIVENFPPGETARVEVRPWGGYYAAISYKVTFSPSMVPGAFTGYFQHYGHQYYSGVLTDTLIRDGLYWYMVITDQAPVTLGATNVSGLVQYWEEIAEAALIRHEVDYHTILHALERLARKTAAPEVEALLQQMRVIPRPMPKAEV